MRRYGGPQKVITGTATGEAGLSPWSSLRDRTRHGEGQYIAREDQYCAVASSHSERHGVSRSWKRHPLRVLWRSAPSAVCCIASLASCDGISDRAGTVGWRSG